MQRRRRDRRPRHCAARHPLGPWVLAASLLVTGARPAMSRAQDGAPVALRIHPRAGDTLRTRFEQDVSMTGVTKVHGVDTTLATQTSLLVLARVVVQASDSSGCTLVVITDSVAALTVEQQALAPTELARRAMQGRRVTLRIKPDGSAASMNAPADLDPDVGALVSATPAVLPPRPVAVGSSWESAIAVPMGGDARSVSGARLRATYRLDSLGAGGARAYLGVRGLVTVDSADAVQRGGTRVVTAGTLTGALTLDRARGWWTDTQLVIVIRSTVSPGPGSAAPPVRVQTTITQRLHTSDGSAPAPPRN